MSTAQKVQRQARQRAGTDQVGGAGGAAQRQQQHGGGGHGRGEAVQRQAAEAGADAQQQQKPAGTAGICRAAQLLRPQPGAAIQQGQGRSAQRPLASAPLPQVGRLHQGGRQHGGGGAKPVAAVQAGGAEGRVGAEDEQRRRAVAQAGLEVQKCQRTQQRTQPGGRAVPARTGRGHRRQRPRAELAAQRSGGQQERGAGCGQRCQRQRQGGAAHPVKQLFQGLSLPFLVNVPIVAQQTGETCREMGDRLSLLLFPYSLLYLKLIPREMRMLSCLFLQKRKSCLRF